MVKDDEFKKFEHEPLLTGTTEIESGIDEFGKVLSIPAAAFHGTNPDVDNLDYTISADHYLTVSAGTEDLVAPVNLPHGARIQRVIVYGSETGDTWYLRRVKLSTGSDGAEMATAAINTEDTSISYGTIDNQNYCYYIYVGSVDNADDVYGARIVYAS